MSFVLTLFRSSLRTQLSSRRTWVLLLLLPLLIAGTARLLPPEEVSTPVQVGVVLPEEGGESFWQRLERRSGLAVTFYRADRSRAERQVASGQWDCALILPEDFEARLARLEGDYKVCPGYGPCSTLERERQTNTYLRYALRL